MLRFSLASFLLLISLQAIVRPTNAQEPEALQPLDKEVQLFDGGDLNQWLFMTNKDSVKQQEVWSVEDGVLRCAGRPAGYLQTKRWYRDYELNLDWRWSGDKGGNSGVLVHASTPLLFYGWPKSMEVQLHAANAGDFWVIGTGVDIRVENEAERRAKPKPGDQHNHRRIRRLAGDFENPIGQWNHAKIICAGDQVKVFINGKLANHGTNMTINEGAIALQSEGTPVEFKDISIKPLSDKPNATADTGQAK